MAFYANKQTFSMRLNRMNLINSFCIGSKISQQIIKFYNKVMKKCKFNRFLTRNN